MFCLTPSIYIGIFVYLFDVNSILATLFGNELIWVFNYLSNIVSLGKCLQLIKVTDKGVKA